MVVQIVFWCAGSVNNSANTELAVVDVNELSIFDFKNFFEMNFDWSFGDAAHCGWIMDKLMESVEAHPAGIVAENEQQALN